MAAQSDRSSADGEHTIRPIFDRSANACDDFARRNHETSWERSAIDNVSTALGRPVLAMMAVCQFI
jgi:hypothetical protein